MPTDSAPNVKPGSGLAVCLGGGGSYAFGFHLGVAHGLAQSGVPIALTPIVGTSGGSHAAVALSTGMSFDDAAPIWADYMTTVGRFWVSAAELTERLYGDKTPIDGSVVAGVAVKLWGFRRVLLWSSEYRLADIVAASSSPVPFVRPHKIGKRRYVDGGFRSPSSVDRLPPASVALVLVPFGDRSQGYLGKVGARRAKKESSKWQSATGGEVVIIGPTPEMCAIKVKGMRDLGDIEVGRRIYDLAVPLGRDYAQVLRDHYPEVVTSIAGELGNSGPSATAV